MKKRLMVIFPIFGGVGHYVCHLKDSLKGYYDLSYVSYKKDYITHKYFDRIEDELISKEIKNVHMLIETDKPQSAFELIGLIKKLKIDIVNIQLNPTAQLISFFNLLITEFLQRIEEGIIADYYISVCEQKDAIAVIPAEICALNLGICYRRASSAPGEDIQEKLLSLRTHSHA